jgi:hypothetical protein
MIIHLLLSSVRSQLDDFLAEAEVPADRTAGIQEERFQEVPRFGWRPEEEFARQAALEQLPLVLNNTQAVKWGLNAMTGDDDLAKLLPGTFECRKHDRNLFLLRDDSGTKGPQMDSDRLVYPEWANFSTSDFLRSATGSPPFLYFSAAVEEFPTLDVTIKPRELLELDELAEATEPSISIGEDGPPKAVSQAVVWLSHPGVRAQMHHDRSHNFFMQVRGRKKFKLYDPRAHQQLHLYPAVSGARRQSQIDFEQAEAIENSALDELKAYRWEVELQPGEMLYIPPFWFHEVESLDLSLSVAVVSPSAQEQLFGDFYWQRLPFALLDSLPKRIIGAQYYLCELFTRMIDEGVPVQGLEMAKGGVQGFMQGILESRHAPMHALPSVKAKRSLQPSFDCYRSEASDELRYEVVSLLRPKLQKVFEKALRLFHGEASKRWWSPPTAAILLADYTEEILNWATTNPYDVKALLNECFTSATTPPSLRLSDPRATGGAV